MNRLRKAAGVSIALIGVAGSAALFVAPREPVYEGKTLAEWLFEIEVTSFALTNSLPMPHDYGGNFYGRFRERARLKQTQAIQTIRRIGNNAVPALERMVRTRDLSLKATVISLLDRQSIIHVNITRADSFHEWAISGFRILGADARSAVPQLLEATRSDDPAVSKCAKSALEVVQSGTGAVGRKQQ
jgi:hypothetical protein